MIPTNVWRNTILAVFALVALIGTTSNRTAIHRSQAEALKNQLQDAKVALRDANQRLAGARGKTDTVVQTVTRTVFRVARADSTLAQTLDHARLALNDSAATLADLRVALGTTVRDASRFRAEVRTLTDSVSALVVTLAEERSAAATAERQSRTTLDLATKTIAAYERAATCKILFVPCPTRTQAAVGVGLVALAAGLSISKR